MFRIREVKTILPINVCGYTLRLMKHSDVEWYTNNIKSDYFTKYMDNKLVKNMSDKEVEFKLCNLVVGYNLNMKIPGEARLILEHETNNGIELIAGCTLFEKEKGIIEVGYWVVPNHQNKGIAKLLLNKAVEIASQLSSINEVRLEIQKSNIWSCKVAESCGFNILIEKKGPYDINLIYNKILKGCGSIG